MKRSTKNQAYRGRALVRTLRLIRLLEAAERHPWTIHQIAKELRVSTRTIRRDFLVLEAAGADVVMQWDEPVARRLYAGLVWRETAVGP